MHQCDTSTAYAIIDSQLNALVNLLDDRFGFDNKEAVLDILTNTQRRIQRLLADDARTKRKRATSSEVVDVVNVDADDADGVQPVATAKPSYAASSGWQSTHRSRTPLETTTAGAFFSGRNPNSDGTLTVSEKKSIEAALIATVNTVKPPPVSVVLDDEKEYVPDLRRPYGPPGEEMDTDVKPTSSSCGSSCSSSTL
jgi:hypothetical protein